MDSKLVLITIALILISNAMGDSAQEKQKCAEQLTNTATCLPYLGGDANAPTSDCCSGLIESLKNNKKCVCLILKDRDDPDLGLKINITLALGLPSLCKASDNFSQCPAEGSSQNGKNKDTTETATAKNCASNKGQRSFLAGLLLWFSI
ncbi:non-specific lipid transfer protein GPI-anchored 14-like isoform X2 [Arachis stenosperma]|uniref:non-specific lipid transfer protein GPI-anchored 14-like isoform X2 n=1 Tax=Arachis stenosperma TaxID=217475 RepID=UPI0025AD9A9D|nr:non-specific lipid transfer protein GPI-anchored 14-like isoform X2 [Arachis stenosperma]